MELIELCPLMIEVRAIERQWESSEENLSSETPRPGCAVIFGETCAIPAQPDKIGINNNIFFISSPYCYL